MWLQSEMKYSLPPHVEMVLHYQQRGNGLFNGHTLHTFVVCKPSQVPLSNLKRGERERERKWERSRNKQMKWQKPYLFVFFTPLSYFTHAVSGENTVCSLKNIPRLTWLYNVARICPVSSSQVQTLSPTCKIISLWSVSRLEKKETTGRKWKMKLASWFNWLCISSRYPLTVWGMCDGLKLRNSDLL